MNAFKLVIFKVPNGVARYFSKVAVTAPLSKRLTTLKGEPKYVSDTKHVQLRGHHLRGNYNDLPNLIFFPEACDQTTSWIPFFTDPNNKDMANDVVRFMYENKISTATLAGHGFGGKLALAVGCYHAERVTGVIGLDTAPLDHRYFESFKEFRYYVSKLRDLDLKFSDQKQIHAFLKKEVACPKWRTVFLKNIVSDPKKEDSYKWNFELEWLNQNLNFNKADSLGYWGPKHGLYTGRAMFLFPEYSRWVHLNTNTLAMLKVCVRLKGFGNDIFYIQGDENPLNHWIYEFPQPTFVAQSKMMKFIKMFDGVHSLLKDRSEIGNYFVPDVRNSRKDSDWVYSDYSPAHLHHNWRFSNIYEEAEKFAKNPKYDPNATPGK